MVRLTEAAMGFLASPGPGLKTTEDRDDTKKDVLKMDIEPFVFDKQRRDMDPHMRFLRKQWVEDQYLTAREPVRVPELIHRNNFRRVLGYPNDILFKTLIKKGVLHPRTGFVWRYVVGRAMALATGMTFLVYYFRHNQRNWEQHMGMTFQLAREPILPGDPGFDEPGFGKTTPDTWSANCWFGSRRTFLDIANVKTSSETPTETSRREAGLL